MFDESEVFVRGKMSNVRGVAGNQIIDCDNAMTLCQ